MSATRYASVLGLGFGDCGKGRCVDALTRKWSAHTVVRFGGGAQAGHHVEAPDGPGGARVCHTFSQFGAGTLVAGTRTLLLDPMVLHPTALLVEAEVLGGIGVRDALARLTIDGRCRLTTPFHQAAGRLREWLRGTGAHGTCGVGVGETVRHALAHPEQVIRFGDFPVGAKLHRAACLDRLHALRLSLLSDLRPGLPERINPAMQTELQVLHDASLAARWLSRVEALARHSRPACGDRIHDLLHQPGCVLFEGAQGVLLDEWRGFHPHTTWSSTTPAAVEQAVAPFGLESPIEHFGVLRTYQTRHGIGPLPTEDAALDALLPEPHNSNDGWQGRFRRGHPDAVLLRYAIEACAALTGLCVGHLDVFRNGVQLKWCERYLPGRDGDSTVTRLPVGRSGDLLHQERLTRLISGIRPEFASSPVRSDGEFLDRLATVTSLPVLLRSYGRTHAEARD